MDANTGQTELEVHPHCGDYGVLAKFGMYYRVPEKKSIKKHKAAWETLFAHEHNLQPNRKAKANPKAKAAASAKATKRASAEATKPASAEAKGASANEDDSGNGTNYVGSSTGTGTQYRY